jgi:hypothetical protein
MIRKTSSLIIALALFAVAGLSLAQNADKNSAGPTKNDLKIRVVEPLEGATITGTTARVAVDYDRSSYREQGNVDKGLDKFPPPTFSVFLDNDLKQTLKTGDTVATIDNIPPGSHKIVILAKNISGEVVDRKEINITAVTVQMPEPRQPVAKEVPREPAPIPAYEPAAPPAPIEATTLPKTASHSPRLALAGLALVACGLLLARKVR